ncbi:MAG: leucine-rich repeat protein [Erysipelotrichaceae bacterium]|nr:leucine-rich repeat protein [Erysipelotrichaceae bacterium]
MLKRIGTICLSLLLAISLTACGSSNEDTESDETAIETNEEEVLYSGTCEDGLSWEIRGSTLTISGDGEMKDYSNFSAPWNETNEIRTSVTSVVIEEGVMSIGNYAFYRMSTITDFTMADTVTSIGGDAFEACTGLVNLQLSRNMAYIYGSAFRECDGLTELSLPAIVKIYYDAFYACSSITTLYLGSRLQFMGEDSFEYNHLEAIYYSGSEDEWSAIEKDRCRITTENITYNYVIPDSESTIQLPNYLMEDDSEVLNVLSNSDVLGNDSLIRTKVTHIYFVDSLDNMGSYAWDASQYQNGSVMAWYEDGNLYIGAEGTIELYSGSYLFAYYSNLESIDFGSNFSTTKAKTMEGMFLDCTKLTSLDVSCFDTANVTKMDQMFQNCVRLTSLDLSNFDTSNVTNMNYMFSKCIALASLDVSSFDTSNVKSMVEMFCRCKALTDLDISNFDMDHAKTDDMFKSTIYE